MSKFDNKLFDFNELFAALDLLVVDMRYSRKYIIWNVTTSNVITSVISGHYFFLFPFIVLLCILAICIYIYYNR